MSSEFFDRIRNLVDPNVEKGINSGDPYTICDLLEETQGGPNGIYLKRLEDAIVATGDIVQIYEFLFLAVDMNIRGFDRERFERLIRNSGNAKLMCYCMGFVPGTNIELMLNALKQTKNAKYMEMLINNEEYRDVLETVMQFDPNYEESVETAKKFDYYPNSLAEFASLRTDILQLKRTVIQTENPHLITELANYIEYLNEYKGQSYDISDLVEAQGKIGDPMQAYEFLASVNVQDKSKLVQAVINSGKVKFMYYVCKYVPGLEKEQIRQLKEKIRELDLSEKYKELIKDEDNPSVKDTGEKQ